MTCQLTVSPVIRVPQLLLLSVALAAPLSAQRPGLSSADSALVGRILLAGDRRDSTNAALVEGRRHADQRISLLAQRATARIRDPKFVGRDSFPPLPPPPAYADPAWRLRFRELPSKRADCAAMRAALSD